MYRDILVAVDLDDPAMAERLLAEGVALVRAYQARLHAMVVVPGFGMALVGQQFPRDFEKRALADAEKALHELTAGQVPDDVPVQHIVANGTIYKEIIEAAGEVGADLVVVGAHRPDLSDYLLGPNAARVMRHFSGSVLVVRL
jgi:nucleotide-binding universal stress UspA family protein